MVGRAHGRRHHLHSSDGHQILGVVDFMVEWTETKLPSAPVEQEYWTM
jgi:hypothetical protein